MKKMIVAVVAALALVGCTPAEEPTPTPTPQPTPASTPTMEETTRGPLTGEEQQEIVDAVLRYLDLWTHLAQNPQAAIPELIWQVAWTPAADEAVDLIEDWADAGWHLQGGPVFTPEYVIHRAESSDGDRYSVHGCYSVEDATLLDRDGVEVEGKGPQRTMIVYVVLERPDGQMFVTEDVRLDDEC